MIGKGAQYLTAAGFGRYRISAASLGSLDLFRAGWLKFAAVQAIMAAFGVDGTAVIRATNDYLNGIAASDKAKATALAGFINEDPMMVCSLGLEPQGVTMPIRHIYGDNTAYILTGIYPYTNTGMDLAFILKKTSRNGIFGGSTNGGYKGLEAYSNGHIDLLYGTTFVTNELTAAVDDEVHIVAKGTSYQVYKNGTLVKSGTATTGTYSASESNFTLFAIMRNGSLLNGYRSPDGFQYCKLYDGETEVRNLVPFKHKTGTDTYECGMLDLAAVGVTGAKTFYGNDAGSGSFTIPDISYTPTP